MNYDIDTIKRKMLIKYPFFGSVVANVDYKEDDKIPTAATDGETIYYNPKFLDGLTKDKQVFVFAHEVCHIAFNHIQRRVGKEKKLWNIATDAVINQLLKQDGADLVEGVVDIEEAINYNAEEYYLKLKKEQNQLDQSSNQISNAGLDSHDMWDKVPKHHKDNTQKQKELEKMGEKNAFYQNKKIKQKQLDDLKKEILNNASRSGNKTNSTTRTINDIGTSKPIIDWKSALKKAIEYRFDWSYRNATIENGVITPHLEKQLIIQEAEIVLDTSSSINEELLRGFLRETKNILKYVKLKAGCFDTKFYGFHDIRTEADIENMEFIGGGCTDFNAAVNAFSRRVENKIIFTDGYGDVPEKPVNAIWIVFGNTEFKPKVGRVIHISPDDLFKLCISSPLTNQKGKSL